MFTLRQPSPCENDGRHALRSSHALTVEPPPPTSPSTRQHTAPSFSDSCDPTALARLRGPRLHGEATWQKRVPKLTWIEPCDMCLVARQNPGLVERLRRELTGCADPQEHQERRLSVRSQRQFLGFAAFAGGNLREGTVAGEVWADVDVHVETLQLRGAHSCVCKDQRPRERFHPRLFIAVRYQSASSTR